MLPYQHLMVDSVDQLVEKVVYRFQPDSDVNRFVFLLREGDYLVNLEGSNLSVRLPINENLLQDYPIWFADDSEAYEVRGF